MGKCSMRSILRDMDEELSFRCEARRRDHGGWVYWIYEEDDPTSSRESYASEHEALLAGFERMEELKRQHAPSRAIGKAASARAGPVE